ncbi:cupin domain-containing protein [Streptomyces sp. NPDC006285]|uniref:cupin domain-containing protein n=1 Tax=Streptomyces sp. NPDC006285 TaxID=3364742 RepID=UPI003697A8A5
MDVSAIERCTGLSFHEFLREYWGRSPFVARAVSSSGFVDIVSSEDIDAFLSVSGLRSTFLKIVNQGVPVPMENYTTQGKVGADRLSDLIDPDAVARYWDRGSSLIIRSLHRIWSPLASLSARLGRELASPVTATAYITPAHARALPAHYDTHDVFVLQIQGSKRWVIHEPVVELPGPEQQGRDISVAVHERPLLDLVLQAGDALYLPRGFIHAPEALDDTSIHVTLGVPAFTWADAIGGLVSEIVAAMPAFRASVPLDDEPEHGFSLMLNLLRDELGNIDQEQSRTAFLRILKSKTPHQPLPVLGRSYEAKELRVDTSVEPRFGPRIAKIEQSKGAALVMCNGRTMKFPAALLPHLRDALDARVTAQVLAARHDGPSAEDVRKMLVHLVLNGLLRPVCSFPQAVDE